MKPTSFLFSPAHFPFVSAGALALLAGLAPVSCDAEDDNAPVAEALDDDEVLAAAAEDDDENDAAAPAGSQTLQAKAPDAAEGGLLCLLCILGGSQEVCGDDNVTYGNSCWAQCNDAEVVHTGECSCGDGYAGPGEACDDGNASDTDACLSTCVEASCGDGFVQAGVEECDDGNQTDGDGCTATCEVGPVCGQGPGTLGPANLAAIHGGIDASQVQYPGQTLTLASSGTLAGVEFGLHSCAVGPDYSLVLNVYDQGGLVASASRPLDDLREACPKTPLDADEVGPLFFDLTDACLQVSADQVLRLELALEGPPPACDVDTEMCLNVDELCHEDSHCYPYVSVLSTNSAYPGGEMWVNGAPYVLDEDLQFKVFVD